MDYPFDCTFPVANVYGSENIKITLYSGLTIFIGANASGKTQTLKGLRDHLRSRLPPQKVRYLTSNRIGDMEVYRSRTRRNSGSPTDFKISMDNFSIYNDIESADSSFMVLDSKKDVRIKVAERLSVLFNRNIYLRWVSGYLTIYFEKTDTQKEYSVAAEASGLINIIAILVALYDNQIQVLLVDEPEVSLHPQLQAYLLQEIKRAVRNNNKSVIIATHSTEFIPFQKICDISNFIFFMENKELVQISPTNPTLESKQLASFVLRMNHEYKTCLFSKKILLVEGISDLMICNFLNDKAELNIEVAGSQILSIDGKGQFPVVTKFLQLIGKDVAVLTDLDGFIDNNEIVDLFVRLPRAADLAAQYGNANISEMIRSNKVRIDKLIEKNKPSLKDIYERHLYWINREDLGDEESAIKRSIIGQLFCMDNVTISSWPDGQEWIRLKSSLETLFSILSELGCFILKRGVIENYYISSSTSSAVGKPVTALKETETLEQENNVFILNAFSDVVQALRHMATTNPVDESNAIRKELLSELALVLEELKTLQSENDIYTAIKRYKGNGEPIFTYKLLEGARKGVNVSLRSSIMDVQGFPFDIYVGQNVNEIITDRIKLKY